MLFINKFVKEEYMNKLTIGMVEIYRGCSNNAVSSGIGCNTFCYRVRSKCTER